MRDVRTVKLGNEVVHQVHGHLYCKMSVDPRQLSLIHPRLHFLVGLLYEFFGAIRKPMVITRILAHYGTHYSGRAVDIRTRHLRPETILYAREQVNFAYPYGTGYDGRRHDTVVFHRQVRCTACGARYEVDPFDGPPADWVCLRCKGTRYTDYGQHFHVQVRDDGPNWKIWNLPAVRLGEKEETGEV